MSEVAAPKQTLLRITDSIVGLFDMLESAHSDEERASISQEIDRVVSVDLADKVDAIAWFDKRCDSEVKILDDIIQEAIGRQSSWLIRQGRIRDCVKQGMKQLGASALKGSIHRASLRSGAQSVKVTSMAALPLDYIDIRTVMTVRKEDVKRALRQDIKVPGAELVIGEDILTIK